MKNGDLSKKEQKAVQTRKKIIKAATRLFARQGFHKTTISDLAREIGLTTGAVFHYFYTKEALLESVIDWLSKGIIIYSDLLKNSEKVTVEVVDEMVQTMLSHFDRNPEATICLGTLSTEFAGSNHPIEARLKQVYEPFIENAAKIFATHPRIKDPEAAAVAILGAAHGIGIQGLFREGEMDVKRIAESFLTLIAE